MPVYEFRCERCGRISNVSLSVDERDAHAIYCEHPDCRPVKPGGKCRMVRQPSAPRFVINGYNEANGYSKEEK